MRVALPLALMALLVTASCSGNSLFGGDLGTGTINSPVSALDGAQCDAKKPSVSCECEEGASQPCYGDVPKFAGVGACVKGIKHCLGGAWSSCQDFVAPTKEACGDHIDNDCDGKVDEGCQCTPGAKQECYSGAAETKGVGPCRGGEQSCSAEGRFESVCRGEVIPSYEVITNSIDDNCDGVSELPTSCTPGTELPCYAGRADTLVAGGACHAGRVRCNDDGRGWSECTGQVLPSTEVCDNLDNDCDGQKDEGLNCGWLRYVGSAAEDTPYDAADSTDGGIIVAGDTLNASFIHNGYVTKLSVTGATVWSQLFSNAQDGFLFEGVDEAADGGAWVVGRRDPSLAADGETLIVKLTNTGALEHVRTVTSWNLDEAQAVAVLTDGSAVILGIRDGGATGIDPFLLRRTGTTTTWARSIAMSSSHTFTDIAAAPDGGFVVVGCSSDYGAGGNDVLVTKWNASGAVQWITAVGGTLSDCAQGVNVGGDGSVFVAAITNSFGAGYNDAFVVKLSSAGAVLWSRTIGTSDYEDAQLVIPATDGGALVTGRLRPAAGTDDDIGVWRLNAMGGLQWAQRVGDPTMIETPQAIVAAPGSLYVAGQARVVPMGGGPYDYQTLVAQLTDAGSIALPCTRLQANAGNVAANNGTATSVSAASLTVVDIAASTTIGTPTVSAAASGAPNSAVCGPP